MKPTPRKTIDAMGAALVIATLLTRPAIADMGPAALIAAGAGVAWALLLGILIGVPRKMFGRRWIALAIYSVVVVGAWIVNLQRPADSYLDALLVFVVPILALLGLYIYARIVDAANPP
jgi:hypothetical protein